MSPRSDKRAATYNQLEAGTKRATPIQHQHAPEIQPYGRIAKLPIALDEKSALPAPRISISFSRTP